MCLSTAYEHTQDGRVLMENVKTITCDGEYVILTDLMERESRIPGRLALVDLVGGVVVVDSHE